MHILLVFYSRTGRTRALATTLGQALGIPATELTDARARIRGMAGFVEAAMGALLGRLPALAQGAPDPQRYDVVIVASPIWLGRLANPMRSWLHQHNGRVARLVVVATSGSGKMPAGAWADASKLSGAGLLTSTCIGEAVIDQGKGDDPVRYFAQSLQQKISTLKPQSGAA